MLPRKRIFTLVALLLVVGGEAVDHNTYKSCAEIPLCGERRQQPPQIKYDLDLDGTTNKGVATFDLKGKDGVEDALLIITAIEGDIFHVVIEEAKPFRYTLEHVLDGQPTVVEFNGIGVGGLPSVSLVAGKSKAEVKASPLSIEFYYDGVLETVLPGDRLSLENTEDSIAFTVAFDFPKATRLYGLHEHADNLTLQNTKVGGTDPYRQRNLDVYMHELNSPMALYGNIPVLYAHGINATAGVFMHNAAQQWVETTHSDDGSTAFYIVGGGKLDAFVLLGPSPKQVVRQYASLTGTAPLPQLWTLGYHQCRWGYWDQTEVNDVINAFDLFDLPIDVIWLDSQHTNDGRFFTWNWENFSDPIGMLNKLASTNRYTVTISDPHVAIDPDYVIYQDAIRNDYFVKYSNGTIFEGEVWPGMTNFFDYFDPAVREYYANLYSYDYWPGTPALGGIWNDMNEPSVFIDSLEKTFPDEIVHFGGILHRDAHAIYGLLQITSTYEGLLRRDKNTLRPFILTRSHFAGTQRLAAIWTGDNQAEWGFINAAFSMCLNANILGISFCGADIGGFEGDPTQEMLQRFYQTGAWLPFFRAHANRGTLHREPYLFSRAVRDVLRDSMNLRYRHLPLWYTVFYEHTITGDPVIRPLFYAYPQDPDSFDIDDQLLLGDHILVKQIYEPGVEEVDVYFPGGTTQLWYSVHDDTIVGGTGLVKVAVTIANSPVYYKGGSVVPIKETPRLASGDMKDDPYSLVVALNSDGVAEGTLFIDDYHSFNYRDNQEYNYASLQVSGDELTITPLDESVNDNFTIPIVNIIYLRPQLNEENQPTGKYVKTVYTHTSSGQSLTSIKFGKGPTTVRLAL